MALKFPVPIAVMLALVLCANSAAAQLRDERELSPRQAYQGMLRELAQEAREAKLSFTLPRLKADFAAQFPHEVDRELLVTKFVRPVDRDPFIDAYIRWQMTSFLDELPEMDDLEFEEFLATLPDCIQNPQVSDTFVQPLMRAESAGELAPSDQKHVEQLIANLNEQREQAGVMRRPAEELRNWIADHVGEEGHRPIQVSVEYCAVLLHAGWPLERIKLTIDEQCEASLRDRSLTEAQRERLARQFESLAQPGLLRINNAYLSEGSLVVSTDSVHVADYEVRKWAGAIRRK